MFQNHDLAFWQGGPTPAGVMPSMQPRVSTQQPQDVRKHTQYPTVSGTSILAIKYKGGVVLAADTLGSYGSTAMYRDLRRLKTVGDSTIIGGSGDMADFHAICDMLTELEVENEEWADGHGLAPQSVHTYVTRVMYNRRTKMNPLWNTLVVGGYSNGQAFLGYVDKVGVAYTEDTMASGYGAHIALPIMRAAYEENPDMTEEQARNLIERCLKVMFYRDARTINRYQIAVANESGVTIGDPISLETNWASATRVRGFELVSN